MILAGSVSLLFFARDLFDDKMRSRSSAAAAVEALLIMLVMRYAASSANIVFTNAYITVAMFGLVLLVRSTRLFRHAFAY
jgi:hypothetical protein